MPERPSAGVADACRPFRGGLLTREGAAGRESACVHPLLPVRGAWDARGARIPAGRALSSPRLDPLTRAASRPEYKSWSDASKGPTLWPAWKSVGVRDGTHEGLLLPTYTQWPPPPAPQQETSASNAALPDPLRRANLNLPVPLTLPPLSSRDLQKDQASSEAIRPCGCLCLGQEKKQPVAHMHTHVQRAEALCSF